MPTIENPANRRHLSPRLWAAITVLIVASAFYLFSVVLVNSDSTVGMAANPWPDGAEYLDSAVSLARDGIVAIHVAGESHPSRYPPAFSLVVGAAVLLGVDSALAPFRVNQVAGFALIGFVTFVTWRRQGFIGAGFAAILLATLPAFVILSRSPLSEISSTLMVVVGVWLLYEHTRHGSLLQGVVGAVLLGVSVSFRMSNLFFFGFVLAAALGQNRVPWRRASKNLILLAISGAVGLLPFFAYNAVTFGSPLSTGYDYWAPYWNASRAFQIGFVPVNLSYDWQELTQNEVLFTTANIYGRGSYVGPSFVMLAMLSLVLLRHRRRCLYFTAAGMLYLIVMTTYFFQDVRLLFPLLVLAVPVAATGLTNTWLRNSGPANRAVASVAALLFVTAVLGWPARDGGLETIELLKPTLGPSRAYLVTRQFQRLRDDGPQLILTDMSPPYLHAVLPPGTLVAPLFDSHDYRFSPGVFVFDRRARRRLVDDSLAAGRSVWAITYAHDIFSLDKDTGVPTGYTWEPVVCDGPRSGIARLVAE